MIAACIDVRGSSAAEARLQSLGNSAGFPIANRALRASGAVMACSGPVPISIDRTTCAVTLGHADAEMAVADSGLVLTRARFGGRSIYFFRDELGVVACSRLEPLVAMRAPARALDLAAVAALLTQPYALPSRTPYRDIERLNGGETALVTLAGTTRRALGSFASPEIFRGTAEDAAHELRARVDASVARAIDGRKKVAVLVSGGVDSSALLASSIAVARGASRCEVEAISLDFAAIGDDRPHLKALSDDLGIVPVRVSPDDCVDPIASRLTIDASPFVWPALGWLSHVGRLAKSRGADLVMTGTGGDELFGLGFDTFVEEALGGNPISALRRALAFRAQTLPSARDRATELLLRPLARRALDRVPGARHFLRLLRKPADQPAWYGVALHSELQKLEAEPSTMSSHLGPTEAATIDALARAPHLTDVADMRAQLEIDADCMRIDPFLSEDLARFLATLPRATFTHGNRHRGLFVHAMRGRVADSVRLREDKGGFGGALERSFVASGGVASIEHLLSMRALEDLGFVRGAEFRKAFSRFLNDQAARESGAAWLELWPPIVLEAFLRGA
jgi:hypothetical protein